MIYLKMHPKIEKKEGKTSFYLKILDLFLSCVRCKTRTKVTKRSDFSLRLDRE